MRVMQWDTDTGVVTLTWPDELSEEDAEFAIEVIQLQLNQIKRKSGKVQDKEMQA